MRGLALIGDHNRGLRPAPGQVAPNRSGIENHRCARGPGQLDRAVHGLQRHAELHKQSVGGCQGLTRRFNLLRTAAKVGPEGGDDAVLTRGLQNDKGGSGGRVVIEDDVRGVKPLTLEVLHQARAIGVPPDATDERHARAEPRRGDGLIGRLAAGDKPELLGQDVLALARQAFGPQDEVNVDVAEHGQMRPGHDIFLHLARVRRPNALRPPRREASGPS